MRYLLIHPTHRKFVRIMRDRCRKGKPVLLKIEDIEDLKNLFKMGTMPAIERHKRLYKIVLRAYNRTLSEYSADEKIRIVDNQLIGVLENRFFVAEWKHLWMTLLSSFAFPIFRWLLNRNKKRTKKLYKKH